MTARDGAGPWEATPDPRRSQLIHGDCHWWVTNGNRSLADLTGQEAVAVRDVLNGLARPKTAAVRYFFEGLQRDEKALQAAWDEGLIGMPLTVDHVLRLTEALRRAREQRDDLRAQVAPPALTVERLAQLLKEYEIAQEPCDLGSLGNRTELATWLLTRLTGAQE